jgi:hypothetical protein
MSCKKQPSYHVKHLSPLCDSLYYALETVVRGRMQCERVSLRKAQLSGNDVQVVGVTVDDNVMTALG